MILNTHPENRKEMVKAICEQTGMNATYLFTPTYAYQVGPITVRRDGSIDCEDEAIERQPISNSGLWISTSMVYIVDQLR